jgi:hypothetical protein
MVDQAQSQEWEKPIESAPRNGSVIRVKRGETEETVAWLRPVDDWVTGWTRAEATLLSWDPTHWKPVDKNDISVAAGK